MILITDRHMILFNFVDLQLGSSVCDNNNLKQLLLNS